MNIRQIALTTTLLVANFNPAQATPSVSAEEATKWRTDLDYLAHALETYHRDTYHDVTREDFLREVTALRERISSISREEIIIGLKRLTAMIHDAHTGFGLSTAPPIGFHSLPIKIYIYGDGVFIQAAAPQYANLVGAKIVEVGDVSIEEALRRIATLADDSSDWTFRSQAQFSFKGEVLHALGLSDEPGRAPLKLITAGGVQSVVMEVAQKPVSLGYTIGAPKGSDWADAAPAANQPLYLQHKFEPFFVDYNGERRLLYVQCNLMQNAQDETFEHFFARVFQLADEKPVDKFVLDLRLNGGGDNMLTPIVVQNIIKRVRLNARGKFFVIIGRNTQSAAQNLVNRLQRDTRAIFVGEPTGECPNHFGDPESFILPNSHIAVNISSLLWQDMDPRDERRFTSPDLAAELQSTDYTQNVDPALKTIMQATFGSIADALEPAIRKGDIEEVKTAYIFYLRQSEHRFAQTQNVIQTLAADLIERGKKQIAVELLKLNAATYPRSAQAIDSLADGYLALGDREHAVESYKNALSIKPNDTLAASRLSNFGAGITPQL